MCMEDVRIARNIKSGIGELTTNADPTTPFLGPDKNRYRLILWSNINDQVGICFEGQTLGSNLMITLTAYNQPLVLRLEDYGEILTKNIFYQDATGGARLQYIQATFDKEKV
jgi:hypothetical protein